MHQVRRPLVVVLLPGAALLLVDGVAFDLGEAQEAADHGEVLPERPVLWRGILLPTQQLTEPALKEGLEREKVSKARCFDLNVSTGQKRTAVSKRFQVLKLILGPRVRKLVHTVNQFYVVYRRGEADY